MHSPQLRYAPRQPAGPLAPSGLRTQVRTLCSYACIDLRLIQGDLAPPVPPRPMWTPAIRSIQLSPRRRLILRGSPPARVTANPMWMLAIHCTHPSIVSKTSPLPGAAAPGLFGRGFEVVRVKIKISRSWRVVTVMGHGGLQPGTWYLGSGSWIGSASSLSHGDGIVPPFSKVRRGGISWRLFLRSPE